MHLCYLGDLTRIQKPVFSCTAFLIIYSWKAGGVKDDSPEHCAIETGINLINLISERYGFCGSLQL